MARVTVSWDDEARLAVRFEVHPGCGWIDFWDAVHEAYRMMGEVSYTVDLIVVADPAATPPMRALANFKTAQENRPENCGMIALVGASMYAEVLFNTFAKVYRHLSAEIVFVTSLDEARVELAALRPFAVLRQLEGSGVPVS